jgi:hypothetical protein
MYTLAYRDGFISNGIVGNRPIAWSTHWAIHDNTFQLHCRDHDDTAMYRLPAINHFALAVLILVGVVSAAGRYIPALESHMWSCRVSVMKR